MNVIRNTLLLVIASASLTAQEVAPVVEATAPVPAPVVELKTLNGAEKPEKVEATGDLLAWGRYTLLDNEAPAKGDNWMRGALGDVPWYTDIRLTEEQKKVIYSELVAQFGFPMADNGIAKWEGKDFAYQLGMADALNTGYAARVHAGLEREGKTPGFTDGLVLRMINQDTDANILVVNKINTARISNAGMAIQKNPRAAAATQGQRPGGVQAQIAAGAKVAKDAARNITTTNCPPGQVWVAPYTNEKGQLVAGRCVDKNQAAQAKAPAPKK